MFPVPKRVLTVAKYIIHIEYSDGTKGDVDLSHLAGKGVFTAWDRGGLFDKVHLHNETHAIRWNDEIEICPYSLYLKIKGLTFNEWWKKDQIHASN